MTASLLLLVATLGQTAGGADTVVVCPAVFRAAMTPWLEYRTAQGHRIETVCGELSAEEIRAGIRRVAAAGGLRFVVLVGDAEPGMAADPAIRSRCVPIHWAKAEVVSLWGSPPHIGTDNWYADLNDDLVPDVAVGRLTADSPDELSPIIQKTIAYEQSNDFGVWRQRLNFVAGTGGFGPMTDTVLETAAKALLGRNVPPDYRLSMTYGNWHSPYCPLPSAFGQAALGRLNEGCLFWVYMGHGYHLALDQIHAPDGDYPILNMSDLARLDCRRGLPIALFLSCYAGALDASEDCLAEEMLCTPGGPVAVLAGSRVTMPYGMTALGTGLLDAVFRKHSPTLGEAVLSAKRQTVADAGDAGAERAVLDLVAMAISPAPGKLAVERREHVQAFNLLGDPLLRIRYPKPVELKLPPTVAAGQAIHVEGTSPIDGRATIEVVRPYGQPGSEPPMRTTYPNADVRAATFADTYRRANDGCLGRTEVEVRDGRFHAELILPDATSGVCQIRVHVEGRDDFAQGAAQLMITEVSGGTDDFAQEASFSR